MITFSKLGKYGRLGNQLFQYSCLYSLGYTKNIEINIPPDTEISKCFDLTTKESVKKSKNIIREKHFNYDNTFFSRVTNDCDIHGYFQSDKYFKNIKDIIKKELSFKKNIIEKIMNTVSGEFTTIHVRRTDYINNPIYVNLTKKWYEKALNYCDCKNIFIVTDDKHYCSKEFSEFKLSPFENHYEDLCFMSLSKNIIAANSTFSWWGSYLSSAEKIICPEKWFNSKLNNNDLLVNDWIFI